VSLIDGDVDDGAASRAAFDPAQPACEAILHLFGLHSVVGLDVRDQW
jgi:hypothetical protein